MTDKEDRGKHAQGTAGFAPIAIMAFRRPAHLRATLQALLACPESRDSEIHVFVDGPRNEADEADVEATRQVARELLGARACYHFADRNRGLANSIIAAVTNLVTSHGQVIVLEDDLVIAPSTIAYFNAALGRYEHDPQVMQISAYMFDTPAWRERPDALFLPITTSWGWATWRRAWEHFDPEAADWSAMRDDPTVRKAFNFGGVYDYARMLDMQLAGRRDSWAIRWYWSVFQANGLILYPPQSLVRNTGFDGSGSHGRGLLRRFGGHGNACGNNGLPMFPDLVKVGQDDVSVVRSAIRRQNGGWVGRMADLARRWLDR